MTTCPSDISVCEAEAVSPLLMVQGDDESREGKQTTADSDCGDRGTGKDKNLDRTGFSWLSAVVLSFLALILTTTASMVVFVRVDYDCAAINPWFRRDSTFDFRDFPWPFLRLFVNMANILGALIWIFLLHESVLTKVDSDAVWIGFRAEAPPASLCFATLMCVYIAFYYLGLFMPLLLMDLLLEATVYPRIGFWLMVLGFLLWIWATWCLFCCAHVPIAGSNIIKVVRAFVSHLRNFEWPQPEENEPCTCEMVHA